MLQSLPGITYSAFSVNVGCVLSLKNNYRWLVFKVLTEVKKLIFCINLLHMLQAVLVFLKEVSLARHMIWYKIRCSVSICFKGGFFSIFTESYIEQLGRFVSLIISFFLVVFCFVPLFRRIPHPPFSLKVFLFILINFSFYNKRSEFLTKTKEFTMWPIITWKFIHLYQNPPTLSSTMKTIFPNENRRNDQINLKIMSGDAELGIKAFWCDEINEKMSTEQSGKKNLHHEIPSTQFW